MASKSAQQEVEKSEVIEELLDTLDKTLDRVKVLYEQFFLGMQKQPPTHIHTDVERKLRDLTQMQIRNTALRYRFATLQQKFGSYNSYWRRTLRQIENGTYHRNLAKIGRQAVLTGEEIPDEILAAMPKRMREQVKRDRDAALAMKRRRDGTHDEIQDADVIEEADAVPAARPATAGRGRDGAFHLEAGDDDDLDMDALFRAVTHDDAGADDGMDDERTNPAGHAFTTEQPTDHDPAPTARNPAAPRAVSQPTQHPNPAVRAAVGMRLATPPAGMPLTSRMTPSGGQPAITSPSGGHPVAQPPARPSSPPVAQPARSSSPPVPRTTPAGGVPVPVGPRPSPVASNASGGFPSVRPPQAPSQGARPLPVIPGVSSARAPVPVESMNGPFPRDVPAMPAVPHPPTSRIPPIRAGTPLPARPGTDPARTAGEANTTRPGMPSIAGPARPGTHQPNTPHADPRPQPAMPSRPGTPPPTRPGTDAARGAPPPVPQSQRIPTTQAIPADAMRTQPIAPTRTQAIKPTRATTEPGVAPPARQGPPPGMTDADVNALYAKYVKAKEAVGETAGPGAYGKLLQTINTQAPKIMEQYKAKGVDFQVVVKDNQVVIRAKPKP